MEVVSHSGLRTALEKLEQDLAEGAAVSAQRLSDLSASTVYWAKIAGQTQQLRRLATLLAGIGDMGAATTLLRDGLEAAPGDAQVALMYSDAIALENDFAGALQALSAASAQQPPGPLARTSNVYLAGLRCL